MLRPPVYVDGNFQYIMFILETDLLWPLDLSSLITSHMSLILPFHVLLNDLSFCKSLQSNFNNSITLVFKKYSPSPKRAVQQSGVKTVPNQ